MSLRYTNKLICTFIRLPRFSHNVANFVQAKSAFCSPIKRTGKSGTLCYSGISTDHSNTTILSRLTDVSSFNTKDFDNILSNVDIGNLSQAQRILLLHCCGKLLSNKSLDFRVQVSNEVFEKFLSLNDLNIADYNTYIEVCTENEVNLYSTQFLKSMKCEPNEETFKLLLENICEQGDTNRAYELLSNMKARNYPVDERVFNALILSHTINDGMEGANIVLATMRAAQIEQAYDTNWNILLGLATRNINQEFMIALNSLKLVFNQHHFMKVLLKLSIGHNQEQILNMKQKFEMDISSKELLHAIDNLCINLIYRCRADIAVFIYCKFVQKVEDDYANLLLEEMLKTTTNSSQIINTCKYLKEIGRNLLGLEYITGISLREGQYERASTFLQDFENLRPHYFWPLLLNAARKDGEIGVTNILQNMLKQNVDVDSETLEEYFLPFCDITPLKPFFLRIQQLNLPMRKLLTPLLIVLLRNGKMNDVNRLCADHRVPLDGSRLTKSLATGWKKSKNVDVTLNILKRISDKAIDETINADFTSDVLEHMLQLCEDEVDYEEFVKFIEILRKEELFITSSSGEALDSILRKKNNCNIQGKIVSELYKISNTVMKEEPASIKHPKNMTVEELECHLTELQNKNMETRGVLRLLIQAHGRLGNHTRVQDCRSMLALSGYEESPGMKSKLFQTYIQTKQIELAAEIYRELQDKHPTFKVDDYKLIDFAALLVDDGKFGVAIDLLEKGCQNRVIQGGPHIERNCIVLINAAKDSEQAKILFDFLMQHEFSTPKNIILGAVMRSYLKRNDLDGAVKYYEGCCTQYKCTPLQVEMMQVLIQAKEEVLLQRVLDATISVYGATRTNASLVVALAEKGLQKPLTKLLLQMQHIPRSILQNKCDKWVKDGKLEPLLTLSEATNRLPSRILDINLIHLAIVKIYEVRNDGQGAANFLKDLDDNEVTVSEQVRNLTKKIDRRNKGSQKNKLNSINVS